MINSYEVGAVFNIIDKASPTLKLLAGQFNVLDRAILRTQEALTRFSKQSFGGIGNRLKVINEQMGALGVNSGKAFGGLDAQIQGSIGRVQALKTEIASLGAEMRGIGRMNMLPGGGGRGGGAGGGGNGGGGRGGHGRGGNGIHLGASQHGVHAYGSGDTFITAAAVGMMWKAVADSAKEISHEVVQIEKLGISEAQLKQVRQAAIDATRNVKGITQTSALGTYGAAYSIFGHEAALGLIQPLARFEQVAGNTSGNYQKAHEDVFSMIKGGDLLGRFNDENTHLPDAAKLNHFLDLGAKVMQATHGKVNANTWFQLAQQGGPAMSGMSDRGLMETAIIAQMMGGPRTGTALTSLYQQMVGGKMTKTAATHLHSLGLVGDFKVGQGGHVEFGKGALDTPFSRALKDSPVTAVGIMKKALEQHGFDNIDKQVPEIFQALGRATTQRLIHDLLRNFAGINAEVDRTGRAMGIGPSKSLADAADLGQAEHNIGASWKKFMEVLSEPGATAMVTGLNAVSGVLDRMTELVRGVSPETLTRLAAGFTALSAVFVGAAFVALMGAIGVGGPFVLGLAAVAAGVAAFWDVIQPTIGFKWEILKVGFGYVVSGVHALGDAFDSFKEKLGGLFSHTNYDGGGVGGGYGGGIIKASLGGANDNGGMQPGFKSKLDRMMADAHAQGIPLSVFSGYRSQAHQDALFANSDGSGHWVARHSNHTRGIAADLRGNLGWAHAHAHEYGLHFPMPWEKWHIEPQGSRGGRHVRPYTKPNGGGHQNLTVMLDGEVIHRSVVKHERRATEHNHQAPTFDGYHDFSAPDGQIWAA